MTADSPKIGILGVKMVTTVQICWVPSEKHALRLKVLTARLNLSARYLSFMRDKVGTAQVSLFKANPFTVMSLSSGVMGL
jgi:hypothetical protein